MAPELLWRAQATVQSDIYGIGVLLYHLVTGSYPVEARTLAEVRRIHERGETSQLSDRRAGLPEPFQWIVELALAPNPADRFATAAQMSDALKASLELSRHATSETLGVPLAFRNATRPFFSWSVNFSGLIFSGAAVLGREA